MKNPYQCQNHPPVKGKNGPRCRRRATGRMYLKNGEGSVAVCRACAVKLAGSGLIWVALR